MANLLYRISLTPTVPTSTTVKNAPLTNLEVDANFKSINDDLLLKAPLASPALTGIPTAPTAAVDTNTTQVATTSFVISQGYLKTAVASSTYAPLASPTFTGNVVVNSTTALKLPVGSEAERPLGVNGLIRYNSTVKSFEGYSEGIWGAIGGGAKGGQGNPAFWENDQTITVDYTITVNKNAGTFGPITIADGVTVTVPPGSIWTIV